MQWYSGKGLDALLERSVNTVTYDCIKCKSDNKSLGGKSTNCHTTIFKQMLYDYAIAHIGEYWTLDQALPLNVLTRFQKLNYLDAVRSRLIVEGYIVECKKGRCEASTYIVQLKI